MELKFGAALPIEEKALTESDGSWKIIGYASVFGNKDLGNDVMMCLAQWGRSVALWSIFCGPQRHRGAA
jgi:hypothetical protein